MFIWGSGATVLSTINLLVVCLSPDRADRADRVAFKSLPALRPLVPYSCSLSQLVSDLVIIFDEKREEPPFFGG